MTETKHVAPRQLAIRCLNVKYSPNLGDGLLSECLEAGLTDVGAGSDIRSIDLAARTAYGQQMAGRGLVMSMLESMPVGLRQGAVRVPLAIQSRRRWAPHYKTGLEGAEAIAVGGGNLLSDLDLNFPTKIALAMRAGERRDLPMAIYACGMGSDWSPEGLRRMRRAVSRRGLRAVFLRDAASKSHWDALLAPAAGQEAEIVRDPGLLASTVWPLPEKAAGARPVIGLGIMSHVAIRYHAKSRLDAKSLGRWYLDLAAELIAKGAEVRAFTNGSPEDVEAAELLRQDLAALPGGVTLTTPATPGALARLIGECDAIAAYRMHAVIAAYSYGVPALALSWDSKLNAFMTSVHRGDWLHDPAELPPAEAARLLMTAAGEGVDEAERLRVLSEARSDVARLHAALG